MLGQSLGHERESQNGKMPCSDRLSKTTAEDSKRNNKPETEKSHDISATTAFSGSPDPPFSDEEIHDPPCTSAPVNPKITGEGCSQTLIWGPRILPGVFPSTLSSPSSPRGQTKIAAQTVEFDSLITHVSSTPSPLPTTIMMIVANLLEQFPQDSMTVQWNATPTPMST